MVDGASARRAGMASVRFAAAVSRRRRDAHPLLRVG